jgi:hypothetical protein
MTWTVDPESTRNLVHENALRIPAKQRRFVHLAEESVLETRCARAGRTQNQTNPARPGDGRQAGERVSHRQHGQIRAAGRTDDRDVTAHLGRELDATPVDAEPFHRTKPAYSREKTVEKAVRPESKGSDCTNGRDGNRDVEHSGAAYSMGEGRSFVIIGA